MMPKAEDKAARVLGLGVHQSSKSYLYRIRINPRIDAASSPRVGEELPDDAAYPEDIHLLTGETSDYPGTVRFPGNKSVQYICCRGKA